jgi:hypothetical protein
MVKLDTDSVKSTPLESVIKWKAYNYIIKLKLS